MKEESLKKDAKYTFMINKEEREKFKIYCKLMNVSPSDILMEVVMEFNENCSKIANMKDITELQTLYQEKVAKGQEKLDSVVEHPTFKS